VAGVAAAECALQHPTPLLDGVPEAHLLMDERVYNTSLTNPCQSIHFHFVSNVFVVWTGASGSISCVHGDSYGKDFCNLVCPQTLIDASLDIAQGPLLILLLFGVYLLAALAHGVATYKDCPTEAEALQQASLKR
jgi:hypothetical protein